ncbi:MAG: transposase [Sphingomonadaceae bacterium]
MRDFARASGQLAKTDAIDASTILRFACVMHPEATPQQPENQARLAERVRRRKQLVNMLAIEKQRLSGLYDADTLASIEAHLSFLEDQVDAVNEQIASEIADDPRVSPDDPHCCSRSPVLVQSPLLT